jgi:hypothetical protein
METNNQTKRKIGGHTIMAKNNSMISTILLLFLSLQHCHVDAAAADARANDNNNPFLKEIMMGRCYEQQRQQQQQQQQQNPTATATAGLSCEDIISSFMNVLESHFESDLESLLENEFSKAFIIGKENGQAPTYLFAPSSSSSSLKSRNSSTSASASAATPMIWMKFFGTNQNSQTTNAVKNMLSLSNNNGGGYVTPETTFGGRLLDGLTFCAQNPNSLSSGDGCSKENSNAYWSFWKAAYKSFTSQIIKDGSSKLVLVIEDPFVDEQFLHDNVLIYLKNASFNDVNADNNQERGGAVTHIDIWGVDCNSSIVIKIMKFLYKNNDESTSSANHENEDNSSNHMFVTTACHGPDLIELGLCYNNVNNKNDRDDNDSDRSNSNNKACDQYKRGKYTRRGDGGETYNNDDENEIQKSHKNDDDIISSNTTIKTTLSPKKSNTHTGPEASVNDSSSSSSSSSSNSNNSEQEKSDNYFLRFFFPSLVLLICIYYRHRYGYIIESYSDYRDGDDDSDRGSSSKTGSSGSFAYSNYSSFVNPFIAGGSSSDNNNSRSNGSSSGQEIGKRSSNNKNNKTNTNNNIAEGEGEGEGEQLLSLPYHCVSQ